MPLLSSRVFPLLILCPNLLLLRTRYIILAHPNDLIFTFNYTRSFYFSFLFGGGQAALHGLQDLSSLTRGWILGSESEKS